MAMGEGIGAYVADFLSYEYAGTFAAGFAIALLFFRRGEAAKAPHGHGALSLLYSVVRIVIFRSLADPLVHKPNVWRYVILVVPAEGGSWKSVPVHAPSRKKGVFGWR